VSSSTVLTDGDVRILVSESRDGRRVKASDLNGDCDNVFVFENTQSTEELSVVSDVNRCARELDDSCILAFGFVVSFGARSHCAVAIVHAQCEAGFPGSVDLLFCKLGGPVAFLVDERLTCLAEVDGEGRGPVDLRMKDGCVRKAANDLEDVRLHAPEVGERVAEGGLRVTRLDSGHRSYFLCLVENM
jgi:hypothetical protein